MNKIESFDNKEFGEIKVIMREGEPWFVAKEVAEILSYQNTQTMTRRLDEDEKDMQILHTLGGNQEMTVINESGLYNAIIGSKRVAAKRFKKWVTSEVLPSIRKHGLYATDELLENPDLLISVATKLKEERIARLLAEKKLDSLKPKVEAYDTMLSAGNSQTMSEVAKILGIGRNKLFAFLRGKKVLRNNNEPYQLHIDAERFEVREVTIIHSDWIENRAQTLVTPKGIDYIYKLLNKGALDEIAVTKS
ncbi:phage antirepressor [Clostridium tunisiense]|uniref:phage antirepressor n=1 Tax=Clostridium tunisiense TaxID=219748 RepID=UPI0003195104|nr:phage antirepressor KilAC domain-containing protein [Clostridium tunisiense]